MNREEIAIKVAHWLSSRRHIRTVHPVIVQIGRRFYPAARYSQAHKRALQDRLYVDRRNAAVAKPIETSLLSDRPFR